MTQRDPVQIHEFIDLPESERAGKTPFIYAADSHQKLIRLNVSPAIIALVEERRKNWHLLQYLDGQHVSKMSAEYKTGIAALQAQVQQSLKQHEDSLDSIARAMVELAASSKAPLDSLSIPFRNISDTAASIPAVTSHSTSDAALVTIEDPNPLCNYKTCYQDIPEIFRKFK